MDNPDESPEFASCSESEREGSTVGKMITVEITVPDQSSTRTLHDTRLYPDWNGNTAGLL